MSYADVSLASTSVTNPVFGAATNFYFDSWVSGSGTNDQSARNSESATAALGNAASSTGPGAATGLQGGAQAASTTGQQGASIGGLSPTVLYIGGAVAVLAIIATIYFTRR